MAASSIALRLAEPADFPAIDALAVAAWQVLRPGYDPAQWDGMVAAVGKMSRLAGAGELIVACPADAPQRLLGAVVYLPPGASNPTIFPEGWPSIRMLVTAPEARQQGLGRRLTEECIARARRDGAACIGLHTSPAMTVALPLYLRMGFRHDRDLPPIAGAPYARYCLNLA